MDSARRARGKRGSDYVTAREGSRPSELSSVAPAADFGRDALWERGGRQRGARLRRRIPPCRNLRAQPGGRPSRGGTSEVDQYRHQVLSWAGYYLQPLRRGLAGAAAGNALWAGDRGGHRARTKKGRCSSTGADGGQSENGGQRFRARRGPGAGAFSSLRTRGMPPGRPRTKT